jgi:hypothetical protein
MYDDFWQEIQDMPSEIFDLDIPEMREFAEEIDSEDVIGYDDLSETLSIDTNYDF